MNEFEPQVNPLSESDRSTANNGRRRSSSPEVDARRETMLPQLQQQMRQWHVQRGKRRTRILAAGAATILLAIFSVSGLALLQQANRASVADRGGVIGINSSEPFVGADPENRSRSSVKAESNTKEFVHPMAGYVERNVPNISQRVVLTQTLLASDKLTGQIVSRNSLPQIRRLQLELVDDDELVKLFSERGQRAILGQVAGETVVVTNRF